MENFICKVADLDELLRRWDYLVEIHPGDSAWEGYRELAIRNHRNGSAILYLGLLDGEIICEATAYVKSSAFDGDLSDSAGLLSDSMAYLAAFRTNQAFEGQGYFGRLYRFMEDDLRDRGYTALCLGVGPEAVRNLEIYFHLGFREYLKATFEPLPTRDALSEPEEELILFYRKRLEQRPAPCQEREDEHALHRAAQADQSAL